MQYLSYKIQSKRIFLVFIIFLFFGFCTNNAKRLSSLFILHNNKEIVIQPFFNFPDEISNYIEQNLRGVFKKVKLNSPVSFSKNAFYAPRNRYKADSIIKELSKVTTNTQITIGLTTKDISTTKNNFVDWGVMGLGYQPGSASVVSSYRIRSSMKESIYKLVLHELGHNYGLRHCENNNCYMRDAKGRNYLNQEVGYCKTCKKYLVERGWQL